MAVEAIGQNPDGYTQGEPASEGIAHRLGRRLLGAAHQSTMDRAAKVATRREQARPAWERARQLAAEAGADLQRAEMYYGQLCAAFVHVRRSTSLVLASARERAGRGCLDGGGDGLRRFEDIDFVGSVE